MRRNDTVLRFQERIIPFNRFSRYDVETGGIDLSTVKGIRQILLIDKASAAVVDDDHAVFHLRNAVFVDHPGVLRKERAVQKDDV